MLPQHSRKLVIGFASAVALGFVCGSMATWGQDAKKKSITLSEAVLLVEKAGHGEVIKCEKIGKGEDAKFSVVVIAAQGERQGYRVSANGKDIFGPFAIANDPPLDEMKAELVRLRKLVLQTPEQQYHFRLIDVERDKAGIYTLNSAGVKTPIKSAQEARDMIKRDREEADKNLLTKDKKLCYIFILPRPQEGHPTNMDLRKYREWFADVEVSFLSGTAP